MKARMLEARVRDDSRWATVTAFGGREYVRGAWRPVPDEQVGSAAAHPFLEIRAAGVVDEVDAVDAVDRVDVVEVASPTASETGTDTDDGTDNEAPPAPVKGKGKRGQL